MVLRLFGCVKKEYILFSRKLVGLLAQTLNLAEKRKVEGSDPETELNLYKAQMARCIANNLYAENIADK